MYYNFVCYLPILKRVHFFVVEAQGIIIVFVNGGLLGSFMLLLKSCVSLLWLKG